MNYQQEFEVIGNGPFPIDMLRYDSCYPAEEFGQGSSGISESLDRLGPPKPRRIKLRRWVDLKSRKPTDGRWRSFGWQVLEDTIRTYKA